MNWFNLINFSLKKSRQFVSPKLFPITLFGLPLAPSLVNKASRFSGSPWDPLYRFRITLLGLTADTSQPLSEQCFSSEAGTSLTRSATALPAPTACTFPFYFPSRFRGPRSHLSPVQLRAFQHWQLAPSLANIASQSSAEAGTLSPVQLRAVQLWQLAPSLK